MKRKILIALSLIIIISLLCSCTKTPAQTTGPSGTEASTGKSSEATGTGSSNPILNEVGTLPLVKEEIELDIMVGYYPFLVTDVNTHYAANELQKRTGIKLNYELVDYQQVSERVTLMLNAGDELPDIITAARMSFDQINYYGSRGVFLPLEGMIENDSYWIKRIFTEYPDAGRQCRAWDGHIYVVPRYAENLLTIYGAKIWINGKWLENLNLDMPTTTEEFYNVLKAFKEQDANNNGDPNDEIPLTTANNLWYGHVGGALMNPFIYDNTGNQLIIKDGKIVPAYTQDEWREGLKYINKLYKEGLLDSECYTQDTNTMKQLFMGDVQRAGSVLVGKMTNIVPAGQPELWQDYVLVPPLKGPSGQAVTCYVPPSVKADTGSVINAKSKHADVAFRLVDYFWSEEARLITCYGEENVDWRTPPSNVLGVNGKPAFMEIINSFGSPELENRIFGDNFTYFETEKFVGGQVRKEGDADQYFYMEVIDKLVGFEPDEVVPPILPITPEAIEEYNELNSSITSFVNENKAKFVVGELDIYSDAAWNAYLDQLKTFRLERYLEIMNEAYEIYKK
ncbi:MAG: extracellular solute-binding protein [Clostridiaceae bacterium]|nr:extracellular solute-binding protein [Clostridiaceae bacterium]